MQNYELLYTVACASAGLDKETVSGRYRIEELALIRHQIINILRKEKLKLKDIGKLLKRDHTTIVHSLNKHDDLMKIDNVYRRNYNELERIYKKKIGRVQKAVFLDEEITASELTKKEITTIKKLNNALKERGLLVAVF